MQFPCVMQKLKGEGKEEAGAAVVDNTPLAKDAQIAALTEDDYFRKNAEACVSISRSFRFPYIATYSMRTPLDEAATPPA